MSAVSLDRVACRLPLNQQHAAILVCWLLEIYFLKIVIGKNTAAACTRYPNYEVT